MHKAIFPSINDLKDDFFIQYVNNEQRTEKEHTHQFFQIFFLVQGKLVHNINGTGAEMSIGEMTIIPPGVNHSVSLTDMPIYYSLSFSLSSLGEINKFNQSSIEFLTTISKPSATLYPKTIIEGEDVLPIKNIFEQIYKELKTREIGFKESVCSYLNLLLIKFVRKYFSTKGFESRTYDYSSEQMVLKTLSFIDEHFCDNLKLTDIAKLSAVSVSNFCSSFKKFTKKTFNVYLNEKRISYANTLIKKGYKLSTVADMCGFNDYATFVRNYKKITGLIPSKKSIKQ